MTKEVQKPTLFLLICVLADQLTKLLVAKFLVTPIHVIGNFLILEKNLNTGIAFGIKINQSVIMILTLVLLIFILRILKSELNMKKTISKVVAIFILGGALGNFLDRLLYGSVIDFISIKYWPTFNLADIFIVVGVGLAAVFYKKIRK